MSVQPPVSGQRRLAAIISADVVGYSRQMARDEKATVQAIRSHRETMRGRIREHHGRLVDAVGDNMLAEFQSAVDAVNCALDVQSVIAQRNDELDEVERMPFRMGIHIGDLLVEDEQIYGDGINIAARLESMAPAGGICLSGAVAEQVRGKTDVQLEDMGEHELKNIPQPVRVWRVEQGAINDGVSDSRTSVAGFGGRPAIAVLPFENRTGDPEQAYLADGIVEDVIAGLSAYRHFPVIARSSTFSYKDKHVDARRIGAELGARYVVGGSVRRAGNRVRVATELVDCKTGHQIQAERFDRESDDVFELQDDIVVALIGSIEPALAQAEARRVSAKPTDSLSAWENLQKGYSLMLIGRPQDSELADPCLRRAIALDPEFADAHAALALVLWARVYFGWADNPEADLAEAMTLCKRAVHLDPDQPRAQEAMGWMNWYAGDSDAAQRSFEHAIELNPSLATAWWGLASMLSEKHPDEAMALAEKAVRLSPKDRNITLALHMCGLCAFLGGHYEDTVKWEHRAMESPAPPSAYRVLAAALGYLGRHDEAREALDEAMRRAPQFTLRLLREGNSPRLVDLLLEGWKKSGWAPPP